MFLPHLICPLPVPYFSVLLPNQAALTKDPQQRLSAAQLLEHDWITRQVAGEVLLSAKAIKEADRLALEQASTLHRPKAGLMQGLAVGPFGWLFLGWVQAHNSSSSSGGRGAAASARG